MKFECVLSYDLVKMTFVIRYFKIVFGTYVLNMNDAQNTADGIIHNPFKISKC